MSARPYAILLLAIFLADGSSLSAKDIVRHRPMDVAGLTDVDRVHASYVSFRFGPNRNDVVLIAFLSPGQDEPVSEMVVCVPGHPQFGTGQRMRSDRRRRDDKGPTLFTQGLTLSVRCEDQPLTLDLVKLEKRSRQGKLKAQVRLVRGTGPSAVSLTLSGEFKKTGNGKVLIPAQSLDLEPTLQLQTVQNGRMLYGSLRCGEWTIDLPGHRPIIPVQVCTEQGAVVEATALRPTDKPLMQIYDWAVELRKVRPGFPYTLRASVVPGPGQKPVVKNLLVSIPVIPSF